MSNGNGIMKQETGLSFLLKVIGLLLIGAGAVAIVAILVAANSPEADGSGAFAAILQSVGAVILGVFTLVLGRILELLETIAAAARPATDTVVVAVHDAAPEPAAPHATI